MQEFMNRKKTLAIGTSNYKKLMETNGYFVDKTLFIKNIIDSGHEVILIPCPRRFGKTLNLSMLKYYFDIAEKNTAKFFEPYKIWQAGEFYTSKQAKYPVIHLSLKRGKANSFEKSQQDIFNVLTNVYRDYEWLLDKDILSDSEKNEFKKILFGEANSTIFENSLKSLSEYLHRYYDERVYILMDEYDAPIHTGFHHGFYDKIIELMKSLMGNTFKDNDFLQKGVITGILRIARESIFSDLNNPGIFTLLSTAFDDKFGFTTEEVHLLLEYFDLSEEYEQIKEWYDGYTFGKRKNIYNPWSIINYINLHDDGFKAYWVNTSSDELIKSRVIEKEATDIRTSLEKLIKGESVERFIDENIVFSDFEEDKEILWSLMVFCGYLTPIKKIDYEEYQLKIPNYEIKILFQKIIIEWFKKGLKVHFRTLRAMTKSLINNQIPAFKKHFKKVMQDTFSYFDVNTEPERVYQAYVLGLLGMLSDDYIIKSNREAGDGRYDILLLPKQNHRYGIIIEIKQLDKDATQNRIDTEISTALNQITKNKYYKELIAHEVNNRIEMAMVFVGKNVHVEVNE